MEQHTKFQFVVHYLMMSGNISPKSPHPSSVYDKYNLSVFTVTAHNILQTKVCARGWLG